MDPQSTSSKEDSNNIKEQWFDAKNQFNKGKFDQSTLNSNEKDANTYYNTASGTINHYIQVFPNVTNMSRSGSSQPQHGGTVTDSRRSQEIGAKCCIKFWIFKIDTRGKEAIIPAGFALFCIASQSYSIVSALYNTFAPLATELVNNLAPGSITVQVLTKGDEAIKSLLRDYFSGKIAREVKEIFEEKLTKERCSNMSVTLKEVGVVMADQEVFDDIKREAEHTLNQLSTSQDSFKNEITFSKTSSILDDKSRVMTEKVSPTATEQDVIDQTRNLELCLQTRTMGMTSTSLDTDQEAQTTFSRLLDYFDPAEFTTSIGREDFCGRGAFASVRRCFHVKLGHVAVKCFEVTGSKKKRKQRLEEVRREANSLIHLSHKNIVRIHGVTVWNNCIGIVMNFVDGGNLDDFLLLDKTRKVSWPLRLRINVEITEGLSYLHHHDSRRSFVHGDLKPQNILLTSEVGVKIADFGAVSIAKSTGLTETSLHFQPTNQWTVKFAAPELLNNSKLERKPSMDVFSYSSIGSMILTRRKLFYGFSANFIRYFRKMVLKKNAEDLENMEMELSNFPEDLHIFHVLKETMEKCGDFEPENRPDVRQVRDYLLNELGQLSTTQLKNLSKERYKCEERGETEQVQLNKFASPFMEYSPETGTLIIGSTSRRSYNILGGKFDEQMKNTSFYSSNNVLGVVGDEGFLGRGGFGRVRLGFIDALGFVAIKCIAIHGSKESMEHQYKKFSQETEMIRKASHKNVVRVEGFTSWQDAFGIIMEYMPGGSLHSMLLNKSHHSTYCVPDIPVVLRLRFCADVTSGVTFLHEGFLTDQRLTHGDLKCENILLTSDLRCKLADFGGADIATVTEEASFDQENVRRGECTRIYAAPERLLGSISRVSKPMDVYSVSMIFYETLGRQSPIPRGMSTADYVAYILAGNRPDSKCIDDSLQNLCDGDIEIVNLLKEEMTKCWNQDPDARPAMMSVRDDLLRCLSTKDQAVIAQHVADVTKLMSMKQPYRHQVRCASINHFAPPSFESDVQGE